MTWQLIVVTRRARAVGLAMLVLMALGSAAMPTAAATVPLALAAEPDGTSNELSIVLPPGATATAIPVYLRNDGDTRLAKLRVYTSPVLARDGALASEAALTASFPTADEAGVLVLRRGAEVQGTLSLDGLSEPGSYTAQVEVQQGTSEHQVLAQVAIDKQVEESISISGAGTDGLALTSRTSRFARSFDLISGSNRAVDVHIGLSPLLGPDNQPVAVELTVACEKPVNPVALQGLDKVKFEIVADTPVTGDYIGVVELVYSDARVTIPLKITRVRPTTSVESLGGYVRRVEIWSTGTAVVSLTLEETEGRSVVLSGPRLVDKYRDVDGAKEATPLRIAASPVVGATTEPDSAESGVCPAGEPTTEADDSSAPGNDEPGPPQSWITLARGSSVALDVPLEAITDPGTYHGTLRFDVVDGTAVDQEFSLVVRRNWVVAALVIGLGVIVGEIIRQLALKTIPNLGRRARLERVRRRWEGLLRLRRADVGDEDREWLARAGSRIAEAAESLRGDQWERGARETEALDVQTTAFVDWRKASDLFEEVDDQARFQVKMTTLSTAMSVGELGDADKKSIDDRIALIEGLKEAIGAQPKPLGRPAPAGAATRRAGRGDRFVDGALWIAANLLKWALVAIAIFLGLQILWVPNATWGSAPDFIAAVLWGVGAWAASGNAFGGTGSLRRTITGEPA